MRSTTSSALSAALLAGLIAGSAVPAAAALEGARPPASTALAPGTRQDDPPDDASDDPVLLDALAHDPARHQSVPDVPGDSTPYSGVTPYGSATPYSAASYSAASAGPVRTPTDAPSHDPAHDASRAPSLAAAPPDPGRDQDPARGPSRTPGRDQDPAAPSRAGSFPSAVQAGQGGSFTASLPALIGGGTLIAAALGLAAHRTWRRRRATG
ncbi:hypothetical protein ACF1B0_18520 [Streptomyces anandii]|uniref:hypothetical protein n=1 Tax=Streptomyces anandii TaxID=285454 RepID=UPI0036F958EC